MTPVSQVLKLFIASASELHVAAARPQVAVDRVRHQRHDHGDQNQRQRPQEEAE